MSQRKKQKLNKNTTKVYEYPVTGQAVRIPLDILDEVREIARAETRTVAGQITVALREYLLRHRVTNGTQTPGILPSSQPAQRHPELQKTVHGGNPLPPNLVEEIMSDDPQESKRWEGTPGAKVGKPGSIQVKI